MKILILKPQDICYGIVDAIAENLGNALGRAGARVFYFDIKKEPIERLASYVEQGYAAVIDVYSGLLAVRMQGEYLWDCVEAPVFQVCVDFPIYIMDKMEARLQRYYTLCMDAHYCNVVRECMPNIRDSYFFPMAGVEGTGSKAWEERQHELVFIGSYSDYREWLVQLEQCEAGVKHIGYAFFCVMRDHTELNQKQAFERVLADMNIELSREEFYQWMKMVGGMAMSAVAYQREQLIRTLLEAGLTLEVYGKSWNQSPFADSPNLVIHEQVDEVEYIEILGNTKLSLNIMYCNKAGYSERYSYSMLNGAICVSDTSEYLCEEFIDGENIIFYELNKLEDLPDKIRYLLSHPQDAKQISDAAYVKAKQEHTWDERAKRFLKILDESV